METKFTSGPWNAGGKVPYKGNECWIMDTSTPERLVAVGRPLDSTIPMAEGHANCLLISAGPDLFEAIQSALHLRDLWAADQHGTVGADHEGEMQALAQMEAKFKAAIHKALNG